MFALLYGGSLCVIGGLVLVAVSLMARSIRAQFDSRLDTIESAHANAMNERGDRIRRLSARCKELERELTEIKLGTATAGYTFEQVPARTVPARIRLAKVR